PATINKYLQTYNDLFEWARRNSHVAANHFSGLTILQNKQRITGKRKAFSNPQIVTILDAVTSNRDGLAKKDYQKWGPLIGIYTGARLNEIAQLHLKDIQQVEGIWCAAAKAVSGLNSYADAIRALKDEVPALAASLKEMDAKARIEAIYGASLSKARTMGEIYMANELRGQALSSLNIRSATDDP